MLPIKLYYTGTKLNRLTRVLSTVQDSNKWVRNHDIMVILKNLSDGRAHVLLAQLHTVLLF